MKEIIKEHIQNIDKIIYLAKVDLIKTYKSSVIGWLWAVLKPAIAIAIYYIALTIGLKSSKDLFGAPYFLWLISGIIPWFFIRDIIQMGSECIKKYNYLVTKIKFPVSIIPTFCLTSKFIVHLLLIAIILIIFIISGFGLNIHILQLPIYMILMLLFFIPFLILLSILSAISKDFSNLVNSFTFGLFWLSGIIWDVSLIKITWIKYILYFNPITFIVNGYRNCFIKNIWIWDEPLSLLCFLLITILTIALSVFIYKKTKKDIPDLL